MKSKDSSNKPRLFTAAVTSKAQITLPKPVRELLGIGTKGDMVGFLVDERRRTVRLARTETVVVDPDLPSGAYARLASLRRTGKARVRRQVSALLKSL